MVSVTCCGNLLLIFCVLTVSGQKSEGERCYESHTKSNGICRKSNNCPAAREAYNTQRIRFDICGFDRAPIICCVEEHAGGNGNRWPGTPSTADKSKPSSSRPSSPNKNLRISEQMCEEYSKRVTQTFAAIPLLVDPDAIVFKKPKCNYEQNPLIVGGKEADLGEFPHMTAVGWPLNEGTGYAWLCGGSLISDRFVLSAGHCTYQQQNPDAESGAPTVVRLGDHDLRDDKIDGANPITVNIEKVIKNPQYKSPSKYHDIALFKLERSVEFNNFVRPACLYSKDPLDARKVIASGWGTMSYKGSTSNVLRKVQLKVFKNDDCQKNFELNRHWRDGFSRDQMCAGDDAGGKDTCQGDSGGPLQVESPDNPCLFYIVGVTGFGGVCGNAKGSGVYAIVSHYLDWIEDEVWKKSQGVNKRLI